MMASEMWERHPTSVLYVKERQTIAVKWILGHSERQPASKLLLRVTDFYPITALLLAIDIMQPVGFVVPHAPPTHDTSPAGKESRIPNAKVASANSADGCI